MMLHNGEGYSDQKWMLPHDKPSSKRFKRGSRGAGLRGGNSGAVSGANSGAEGGADSDEDFELKVTVEVVTDEEEREDILARLLA
eukprot:CAMPEP_0170473170 /NCGR_PEP_ID=MMETSP0123-20130129/15110_1 /TAXON_ID=182087 /ORGANISM="Favella ehrenbergii, Strain Fehren 1" /LENGTH=84 /DNA_ID=CAMNT_0010741991 /DNA_START=113 /DNA_END=367 /DNA_ORIENTATION=+